MTLEKEIGKVPGFSETRLNSLYLNFDELKLLNPEGYEANIHAWTGLLKQFLKNHLFSSNLAIPTNNPNISQLLSNNKYGKPRSIATVFQELLSSQEVIPLSQYLQETESYHEILKIPELSTYLVPKNWYKWGVRYITGSKFKVTTSAGELVPDDYIVWDYLVEVATEVIENIYKDNKKRSAYSDLIFDLDEFKETIETHTKFSLSQTDLEILLTYYSRDTHFIVLGRNEEGTLLVKLYSSISDTNRNESLVIEKEDYNILALKKSIKILDNRKTQLETRLGQLLEQQNDLLKDTSRSEVKVERLKLIIRLKHVIQKSFKSSLTAYEKLTTALSLVDEATGNVAFIQLLEKSTELLQNLNSKADLDKLDTILSTFEESTEDTEAITLAISAMNVGEEEDVDEEYEKLLEEETRKQAKNTINDTDEDIQLLDKLNKLTVESTIQEEEKEEHRKAILEGI